jgi:hypothetical protein
LALQRLSCADAAVFAGLNFAMADQADQLLRALNASFKGGRFSLTSAAALLKQAEAFSVACHAVAANPPPSRRRAECHMCATDCKTVMLCLTFSLAPAYVALFFWLQGAAWPA